MPRRILIYGATGFSGRLIAAEAAARSRAGTAPGIEWLLASRDARALARVAQASGLGHRAFALDDVPTVRRALEGIHVVLNAAGPFASTGEPLARAAILAGCHYVDINGEVDVYKRLDDLGRNAALRERILVCGAGQTAAVSDLMLTHALKQLATDAPGERLGPLRIAATRLTDFSRGSAQTMLRAVREQVAVAVRDLDEPGEPGRMRLSHEPIGRLERSFDFSLADEAGGPPRIASAMNMIDTLVAKRSCERAGLAPERIESYVEMPLGWRLAYQAGALCAPLYALPGVRRLAQWQLTQWPAGPDANTRAAHRHRVVLVIESACRETLVDWRLETPDPYDFSARSAVAVALELARRDDLAPGWQTPGAVLAPVVPLPARGAAASGLLRDCRFEARRSPVPSAVAPAAAH